MSDTAIFGVVFLFTVGVTAVVDALNGPADPPNYLVGLCGAAGSALFGAASSDKSKRDKEVSATATRAESKADDALGRSDASMDVAMTRVLHVQERELAANRAALQLMREAVEVKQSIGVPVLPETFESISQLEAQTDRLAEDIIRRRMKLDSDAETHRASMYFDETARETAARAESKADDALRQSAEAAARERDRPQHKDHGSQAEEGGQR